MSCEPCKGHGPEKAKIQSQIAASNPSYLHKLKGVGGTKAKKLKEGQIVGKYVTQGTWK